MILPLRLVAALSLAVPLVACGDDPVPPKESATPDQVRAFYGLTNGTCFRYRYPTGGAFVEATISVSGPNDRVVAGHVVYIRKYATASQGEQEEDYFDTESNAEIRLLRHLEGVGAGRTDMRYQDDPTPPLFAQFDLDKMKQAILEVGARFETMPTPAGGAPERHVWTVISSGDMVPTPDGMKTAYKLEYRRGAAVSPAIYWIVPGYGLAQFDSFAGNRHSVCAARICDAAGACTGVANCDDPCP